ncbi:jerky-like protein [Trichonephila clavipes]|nr:jerky-like protein [Trichonephila clavipes]
MRLEEADGYERDPISGPLLHENEKLGGLADFKDSNEWLKSRHGIRELQIEGDMNSAHKLKETFLQYVEEEGYSRDDVYNVDETGVNWVKS